MFTNLVILLTIGFLNVLVLTRSVAHKQVIGDLMQKRVPNWIAFYNRNGEEVSLPFYFYGRPSLENVVSRIRKQPQAVEFVLPYAKPGTGPEELAKSFMFVNGITGLVFTPFVNSNGDIRS